MRIWRSLLFVPANQRRMLDKLGSLPADGFIFDLEDTVPPAEKVNARAMAKETIAKTPGDKSWVRVNAVPSGYLHEDLAEFVGTPGLAGFVVPNRILPAMLPRSIACCRASRFERGWRREARRSS